MQKLITEILTNENARSTQEVSELAIVSASTDFNPWN